MKFTKHTLLFFLLCISQRATAQEPFIKLADIFYTREAIVLPAGQGWVVLTGDSLRLTKFNSCGYIEWSKQYNLPSVQYGLYDFIALQNGDFGLMYRYKKQGEYYWNYPPGSKWQCCLEQIIRRYQL